ncbi:MAG: hypothetical protein OQK75_03630 [Gammaproteobacteria bacterium]|nr:hypothetical protein [Gammaproteobacteria bacterium]MCW8986739.1 hypothetical protein [Gammaproteobacteria bacterium]MCW9031581.1 hypothetical protein [Gammaproteobacteria bacterium]
MNHTTSPSAELLIATGCVHCPVVLGELSDQLKKGKIASLKITNIAVDNQRAAELNVRSVPWFSLSADTSFMIFSGSYSPKEIQQWLSTSQDKNGMQEYIENSLSNGQLATVLQAIQLAPETFSTVIAMLEDEDTSMEVRIGLDALVESLSATDILKNHAAAFKKIAATNNLRLQIDALHYLALTGNSEHKAFLQEYMNHDDQQVKEAAAEALETLNNLTE